MKFVAKDSTSDGRITLGGTYIGHFIYSTTTIPPGLRIVVYDNKGEWMTFKPILFKPARESNEK